METLRRINEASGVAPGERERLLGPAFAHTAVGMAIADREGRILEANSAFLDIVGRSFEELTRENVESITHPEDRAANAAGIRLIYAGEAPDFRIEKRYVRPDGSEVWVRNSLSVLRDENGEPVYTICISENIDAQKRAEQASAQARETLEMATRAADLGIWDLDLANGALHWSDRCREIFGVGKDAALTLGDFYLRLHPDDRERLSALSAEALDPTKRKRVNSEYRVLLPSGEVRWAAATAVAYFEPAHGGEDAEERAVRLIGTIVDITERRHSIEALVQAEKLAATGRLAASIAHEINNPLEAVMNLLFLLREAKDGDDRASYLSLAEQEIKRVSEIATQTLRFYRDPAGPTACDLKMLAESVLTLFHGRMHLLSIEPELRFADGCSVFGSQGELRQVLVNLVGNALDAMAGGGRLMIRSRIYRGDKPGVRLTIADTGEGMSRETMGRLFRPFFTTKSSTGTGLGLWLSLEILNKHGASIRVRSRSGVGTAVSIFFPERPAAKG
ncbi:MAG TPA: PAS domain S-box protein [Acidobacteriaceae bacterium]|jgi:PAS domain S-box-containing protein|nr:PAS domain S-box protein [Acidobacteriaceae bacterium]